MPPFDLNHPSAYTRRSFLGRGLVMASAATTVPYFVQQSAQALMPALGMSSTPGMPEDRVLVVVQLGGGNDGLNTVIPFRDGNYYKARPAIGIPEGKVLKLGKDANVGLHPGLAGFKEMYDAGMLAVVQGVGYPNPNRSHFKSMDIWQTADTNATGNGWLGRYFDNDCCGFDASGKASPEPMAGIAVGKEAPLAMQGQISKPIGFESSELFQWLGKGVDPKLVAAYDRINTRGVTGDTDAGSNAGFLMRTAMDAQIASDQIRKAVAQRPLTQYPNSDLARQLQMVASMVRAGLKTRVYYVTLGGFDTHAGQGGENGRQAQLLQQVGSSLKAFYDDLKKQGNDTRVLTVSFSEFGRRVQQNASGGTDHGAAAPMFLMGPMIRAGVIGNHPSLTDLDAGDLKYGIDFRSVYAGVLEGWLKADSRKILEASYKPVSVVKTA
jgi:uncharacterized protein (DUF1501 family)